ncbi:MAG: hypothetical protein J6Y31_00410, partial [Bacteroidales bacterium]|nr:hypothetical protein [Bacteroidales bacterium]
MSAEKLQRKFTNAAKVHFVCQNNADKVRKHGKNALCLSDICRQSTVARIRPVPQVWEKGRHLR